MERIKALLKSGMIELYVMGLADANHAAEIETLARSFPEIQQAIDDFSIQMEGYLQQNAVPPSMKVKPMIMAIIEYKQRLKNGQKIKAPPGLHQDSRAADYAEWLALPGMSEPLPEENITLKIIGLTPTSSQAILWIRKGTPWETHQNELESFLVLEGTCIITIGTERHLLSAGDYLAIPLFQPHQVVVTSTIPCKAILQRLALAA
ncbi:cupin domain-containing protein [Ferruginibacter sp. HRS2-29]|uniref:cupin domain-containing protein n=1 Tax=Ferruginibacter sp. HRS2-29 TaxID=2487334 RepID=UPI0020CBC81E|nr:cupin domain-containing protein [Ferruginibacter sp. HRS2-29]MCP9750015.1 cupin domain-containing protein [Ferruginibacter sp. HRS2-29]